MSKKIPRVDPLANALADGTYNQIGLAYQRTETCNGASEFSWSDGLTPPGLENADPPLGRYHGQRGSELLRAQTGYKRRQ